MTKDLLAQALREYPTWGDAYIAERERREAAERALRRIADEEHVIDGVRDTLHCDIRGDCDCAAKIAREALSPDAQRGAGLAD